MEHKVSITKEICQECMDRLKGAFMIVCPNGLPKDHPISVILSDSMDPAVYTVRVYVFKYSTVQELFDPATATLWWANKELLRTEKLSKYIGTNEKTKIVAKLGRVGRSSTNPSTYDTRKALVLLCVTWWIQRRKRLTCLTCGKDSKRSRYK